VTQQLILKRASASRPSGEWNDDDFDVLADGVVVGRIFKVHAAPEGTPWMWALAFGHHKRDWRERCMGPRWHCVRYVMAITKKRFSLPNCAKRTAHS
jgi:hypothetical protein